MRQLLVLLLLCGFAFCSDEITRPTSDADGGANTALGCIGLNRPNLAMPLAWDAAGLTTDSVLSVSGTTSFTRYTTRTFSPWAAAGNTYSTLTLHVNASSSITGIGGTTVISYSTNNGVSWTVLTTTSSTAAQQTYSATLSAGQDLSKLQVGTCAQGNNDPTLPGSATLTVWDIWADGAYNVTNSGSGNSASKRRLTLIL